MCSALWRREGGKQGEQTLGTGYSMVRCESFGRAWEALRHLMVVNRW